MSSHAKCFIILFLVLPIGGVWFTSQAQSGRKRQQPKPAPATLPEIVSQPSEPASAATPLTRGTGTPVQVAFAPDRQTPAPPVPNASLAWHVISTEPLATRLADWLYLKGGLAVTSMTEPTTAQEAQALALNQADGYVVWLQLEQQRIYRVNPRCSDLCSADCLREYSNYQVGYRVFAAKTDAPVREGKLEVKFDKYAFVNKECNKKYGIYEKSSGGSKRLFGAPVCFNKLPNEFAPETFECVGHKLADQLNKKIKPEKDK